MGVGAVGRVRLPLRLVAHVPSYTYNSLTSHLERRGVRHAGCPCRAFSERWPSMHGPGGPGVMAREWRGVVAGWGVTGAEWVPTFETGCSGSTRDWIEASRALDKCGGALKISTQGSLVWGSGRGWKGRFGQAGALGASTCRQEPKQEGELWKRMDGCMHTHYNMPVTTTMHACGCVGVGFGRERTRLV